MRQLSLVLAVLFAAAVHSPHAAAQAASELRSVRFGVSAPDKTRIVFDMNGAPQYALDGDGQGAGRLFVDLSNLAAVRPSARDAKGRGLVSGARYAPNEGALARVVVTLRRSAKVDDAFVIPPSADNPLHRLVIDLSAADKVAFLASIGAASSASDARSGAAATAKPKPASGKVAARADTPSAKPQRQTPQNSAGNKGEGPDAGGPASAPSAKPVRTAENGGAERTREAAARAPERRPRKERSAEKVPAEKKVVVIDPGHGGTDPGAIGVNGTKEKTVTLAAAQELQTRLEAIGDYRVVLTRAGDERLALQERAPIARNAGADLFISIHADALKDRSVRGASVYTLSEEGTQRSAVVAEEEGDLVVFDVDLRRTDPDVRGILFDLAHEHTGSRSDQLAELIVARLGGVTPLLNNTHRRGDLRVLLAPDVPAVLLELGFLSNADDERNFVSEAWRSRTMAAVAKAIDSYFNSLPPERHADASNSASR